MPEDAMKNLAIILLVIACAVLGGLHIQQRKQAERDRAWIAELQKKVDGMSPVATKSSPSAEKKVRELRSQLGQTASQAAQKSTEVAQLQEKLASAGTNDNPMKGLADMFKSPEMKEMIQKQQKAMMGPMVEKSYGSYFQHLKLNDDQKNYLKDLLSKKMMAGMESGMEMLSGDMDKAKQEEMSKKVKAETDAYDQQIKDYLGKENYAQFQEYEKTMPERMQLGQFTEQLTGATALSGDQEQQLLQLMAEERQNSSHDWVKGFGAKGATAGNIGEMFTEENITKFAEEKEKTDQRMLVRAQKMLSHEQYTSFEQFITAQREMQMMGMKMGAKMFAPKGK
jgi:hypothetical protein